MLNKREKTLLAIFLAFMIPNIFVYAYHMNHEFHEAGENSEKGIETNNSGLLQQAAEQRAEGVFFAIVTIGYVVTTMFVLINPNNNVSYYTILIGTVVIIIIYYLSKTSGVPIIDGYDNWIVDNSTNWKDNITKIAQQVFVIPLAMLMERLTLKRKIGVYVSKGNRDRGINESLGVDKS